MNFFQQRKRKKFLAELKTRRHAEDDLLSPALRLRFDGVIKLLAEAPAEDIDAAMKRAQAEYEALPLPKRGKLFGILDILVVVGCVAFGLRGLFFQPFRIPTGSMQPTLFGHHYQQKADNANWGFDKLPGVFHRLCFGSSRAYVENHNPIGDLQMAEGRPGMIFDYSDVFINGKRYHLPGNMRQVYDYAGIERLANGAVPEEAICDGYMTAGDHLFVERVSMYLSPPERGDIIVFNTEGLTVDNVPLMSSGGYYYVKRLAALPGDTVKIVDDQLYVRPAGMDGFRKIQELDKRFEKIYSMRGGYHGHLSNMGEQPFASGVEYTVPADNYLMLGDNSKFSMDSRYFGTVPRKNLVGRAWIVFYPFTRRIGSVDRENTLDVPTGDSGTASFPVMGLQ
ncbi:MAG: signal peptidase I [Lentisphaerae bacterium]|nr:signal peptidase I [Lentisphaerota bacterium]